MPDTTPTYSGGPAGWRSPTGRPRSLAGFRWIIPAGPKFYVVGNATPAYTWYDRLENRRFFGGSYSAFLLGFFNRATLEVGGFNTKQLNYVSSEAQAPVIQTTLDGSVKMEASVASNFADLRQVQRGQAPFRPGADVPPDRCSWTRTGFQRTEGAVTVGVRYTISSALDIAASYQKTRTEFVFVPQISDNQSDAYLITLHYDRPRFYLNLSGGYRQGGPFNGSSFSPYTKPTGGYFMSYFLTRTVELQAYGDSRVTYGVLIPQFIQTRYGGGINWRGAPQHPPARPGHLGHQHVRRDRHGRRRNSGSHRLDDRLRSGFLRDGFTGTSSCRDA